MPISFSMIVLSSQLVIAVADQVPKFDIARSCKLDAPLRRGRCRAANKELHE